ncbi:MAG TPA: class I SAM-dependent methyltransferase [Candidatus Limnocylindria bacterium]|nr:class I SAM-dependent methyltransferase [Candidatus Limnocylindria bacterium]
MSDERAAREWQAAAAGARRWEPAIASLSWPLALRMAAVTEIGPGQRVLDVGCGIGDPTLQVAVLVGPHGRVVGIDLAEAMLAIARERAAALGLSHVDFIAGDVATMTLPAPPFDVVLGRWSLIYLDDMVGTLARLRDVLVPGGRIAVAAWAPPDANPWIAVPLAALAEAGVAVPSDPTRPGIFHCSEDGALARALLRAGFQTVDQERVRLSFFAQDATELWTMVRSGIGDPLGSALEALDASQAGRVARRVGEGVERYRAGDVLRIPAQAQLAWGRA